MKAKVILSIAFGAAITLAGLYLVATIANEAADLKARKAIHRHLHDSHAGECATHDDLPTPKELL